MDNTQKLNSHQPKSAGLNHYEVLEVSNSASVGEIRSAYLTAARKWHPDRAAIQGNTADKSATEVMGQANEAWRVLGNGGLRADYDRSLKHGSGQSTLGMAQNQVTINSDRLEQDMILSAKARQVELSDGSRPKLVRFSPLIFVGSLLGLVLLVSAFAPNGLPFLGGVSETEDKKAQIEIDVERVEEDSNSQISPGTAPTVTITKSLGRGIDIGDCVDVNGGPSLIERPCGPTAGGRVVGGFAGDGSCIDGAFSVPLTNGVTACLVAVKS